MSLTIRILAIAAVLSLPALLHPALPAGFAGQKGGRERVIKKHSWPVNEAVKIIGLKVKGKDVEGGKKFDADDDWPADLTVKVKNFSDRPIVYIEIELWLFNAEAEPDRARYPYVMSAHYGFLRVPGDPVLPRTPKPVPPGGVVDLVFDEGDYDLAEVHRLTQNFGHIKEAELIVNSVLFDDGLKLSKGTPMRRDPNNPNRWFRDDTAELPRISLLRPQARPRQTGARFDLFAAGFYNFRATPRSRLLWPCRLITGRFRRRGVGGVLMTISSRAESEALVV